MTQATITVEQLRAIFGPIRDVAPPVPADGQLHNSTGQGGIAVHRLTCGPMALRTTTGIRVDAADLSTLILFPTEGEIRINQNMNVSLLRPGDVMAVSNWIPYELQSGGGDLVIVRFPGWWAFENIWAGIRLGTDFHLAHDLYCAPAMHQFARSLMEGRLSSADWARAPLMLAAMLRTAFESVSEKFNSNTMPINRFGRVFQFICSHADEESVSPQAAAVALKCSLRTVHKTCADHGTSFNALVVSVRISRASYLLSTTQSRISEIAFSNGFGSLSHFCRLFKAQTGWSATEYRKRHQ